MGLSSLVCRGDITRAPQQAHTPEKQGLLSISPSFLSNIKGPGGSSVSLLPGPRGNQSLECVSWPYKQTNTQARGASRPSLPPSTLGWDLGTGPAPDKVEGTAWSWRCV